MSQTDRHRSPTVVLLLPVVLEAFERRPLVDELLRADAVVAVDPPRAGYRRWPAAVAGVIAQRQAKRLAGRLPGAVGAVVIFDPGQARLGSELAAPDGELFYGPPADVDPDEETHLVATERAALVFDAADADPLRDAVADVLLQNRT